MADILFLDEAAAAARVSVASLRRAIKARTLRATKKLGRWRIRRTELERWLEASDERSRPAAAPVKALSASVRTEPGNTGYLWEQMRQAKRS